MQTLGTIANHIPDRVALFYATDDQDAGAAAAYLIEASGYAPVHGGGTDQSIRIEVGGGSDREAVGLTPYLEPEE